MASKFKSNFLINLNSNQLGYKEAKKDLYFTIPILPKRTLKKNKLKTDEELKKIEEQQKQLEDQKKTDESKLSEE